ncbi:MAG: YitT family protein [Muribaculaceae bacterium]
MTLNKNKIWRTSKDYIFITFGMALFAFGFTAFILPEKVVIGGLAGIGTIVYFLTGIPVAITQYAINLALLAIAYKIVGKRFVIGTIYGATVISLFIGLFQPLFASGFTDEPFMNIVIGGTLCGLGIGMTFVHNGSSGGTDIIAAMVSKHSNVTIGRTMLYTDVIIISSSFLLFHNIDKVVYGFVVLFLVSYMADMVVNTNRQAVQFTIFSKKWEEIATAINNEANRGCTVLTGMGWYSKSEVKMLIVMCRKIESVTIGRIIKSIDADAFVTQANVNGVYGKGFDELKVKMKNPATAHQHQTPAAAATVRRVTEEE